jgi:hypothetical protein
LELAISGRCLSARLEEAGILDNADEPAEDANGFAASSARRSH